MASAVQQIDYGMFIMPFHDPAKPMAQAFDEDLELIVLAEQLGFKEFWIGEHHTMKFEPIVMPEIFIARALGETSRIRLGPAPGAGLSWVIIDTTALYLECPRLECPRPPMLF